MSKLSFSQIFWKFMSIVLLGLTLLSILGAFGITSAGEAVFLIFAIILGNFAAIGPFVLFCFAVLLWFLPNILFSDMDDEDVDEEEDIELPYNIDPSPVDGRKRAFQARNNRISDNRLRSFQQSPSRVNNISELRRSRPIFRDRYVSEKTGEELMRENRIRERSGVSRFNKSTDGKFSYHKNGDLDDVLTEKGVPLPPTKLVSLKGFVEYFSSDEWVENFDVPKNNDMRELGRDFPTYFGEGEKPIIKFPRKMTSLEGMKNYFHEVDEEIYREIKEKPKEDIEKPSSYFYGNSKGEEKKARENIVKENDEREFFPKNHDFQSQWNENKNSEQPSSFSYEQANNKSYHLNQMETVSFSRFDEDFLLSGETKITKEDVKTCEAVQNYTGQKSLEHENNIEQKHIGKELAAQETAATGKAEEKILKEQLEPIKPELNEFKQEPLANQSASKPLSSPQIEIPVLPLPSVDDIHHKKERKSAKWQLPGLDYLEPLPLIPPVVDSDTSHQLERVLNDFGVKAKVIRVVRGPVITRYELAPAPGVKISKIVNLADDIALALAARDVRIEAPIPGKSAIGIEVPNKNPRAVVFREVLETQAFKTYPSKLKIALGKDISDQPVIGDLAKMPHLLVAGATGSGKSVCITAIINSILFNATPDEVKFLMIDPKMVELNLYNGIPHLLAPVVTDPKKASAALKWIVKEMENRYELFAAAGVRDIERYNQLKKEQEGYTKPALPYITVIIDELADLMMVAAGEVEEAICRLAQMARAAGIHIVIATQRPSVDVITGLIKANIPSRISFAVTSQIDSRTILDTTGAEKLLGRGDMLYSPQGLNKPMRVQGCYVTDDEVARVIKHWKEQGSPEYLDPDRLFADGNQKKEEGNSPDDELFLEAGRLLIQTKMASTSFLQRKMKLGYSRAARLIDMLEEQGVVGPYEGSKPRQILMTEEEFNERFG